MASLPKLPATHSHFIPYLKNNPKTPLSALVKPYSDYEAKLREIFAQSRDDPLIQDPKVNVVPVFEGHQQDLCIRARALDDDLENRKYIMPLKDRKPDGAPGTVPSLDDFKQNFNLFSESSLVDLDWNNVVAAGSAVVTSLLPVSEPHNESKRALRQYYHEQLAPSSDVDLFIWGLDEEEAIEKIKQIERRVKDSILAETTTIRTKNAITIASQYPTRHIQIVLRLYKSVSEILTGFDVDCSCFAYDGSQVYGTPRAITAFMSQCNTIDLSRRSPSYENRLSKYAQRGFEVYWPELERSRIDPTIYERSFGRIEGLARLLVLERLPKESEREAYLAQRREERGRPPSNTYRRKRGQLRDNFKDKDPQDVAEWNVEEQEIANYHTFTVPYGPRYNAKKIEKLLFTKDLLLNAEWNTKPDRKVNLHRHPCFIGDAEYVIKDCCTSCPKPTTTEEEDVAAEESKVYVAGAIEFMKDDPGRQTIGSFHPLTSEDWTDQAYIGNTETLMQAIVEGDLEYVQEWATKIPNVNLNRRDHTGRTPLHLACQVSNVEIVKCLVDAGARIVARLADGMTALHLACVRGNSEIVQILLEKSEENEEVEADKETQRQKKKEAERARKHSASDAAEDVEMADSDEDIEMVDQNSEVSETVTQGSFVKVKESKDGNEEAILDQESEEPDFYDINVLAWDAPVSPLHLCILVGQLDVIPLLISKFGADVLLPVKLLNSYDNSPRAAILTLVLAAQNPTKSVELTKALLHLRASPAQSDMNHCSALHYTVILGNVAALKAMFNEDQPKSKAAANHLSIDGSWYSFQHSYPLSSAIRQGNEVIARQLLEAGVAPEISFEDFAPRYLSNSRNTRYGTQQDPDNEEMRKKFDEMDQPIVEAMSRNLPTITQALITAGVSVNSLNRTGKQTLNAWDGHDRDSDSHFTNEAWGTLLDVLDQQLSDIKAGIKNPFVPSAPPLKSLDDYLEGLPADSYQRWQLGRQFETIQSIIEQWPEAKEKALGTYWTKETKEKHEENLELVKTLESLREFVVSKGGKTFRELHPEIESTVPPRNYNKDPLDKARSDHKKPEPMEIQVSFGVSELIESLRKKYIDLFEVVWAADAERVREMTTKSSNGSSPLKIAVKDNLGVSPFHIAVMQGNYDLANMILDIANLQYQPDEPKENRKRYFLRGKAEIDDEGLEDDIDSSDDSSSPESLPVDSELVDEEFTIDDVENLFKITASKIQSWEMLSWFGTLWAFSDQSEKDAKKTFGISKTSPTLWANANRSGKEEVKNSLSWSSDSSSLMNYAVRTNNIQLVKRIFKWDKECRRMKDPKKTILDDTVANKWDFFRALKLGHTEIASEILLSTGINMPIEELVEKSGVTDDRKSEYYQGLLLRGKYKNGWAKEAKGDHSSENTNDLHTPPLLQACVNGELQAVEWIQSDTPARLLKQWLASNNDERLAKIGQSHGGLDNFINEWLENRRNLAIHMAVLTNKWDEYDPPKPETVEQATEILKYLIKTVPESLETKSASGHTPLSLAFMSGRTEAAKILLAAGANQSVRDNFGRNILHLILVSSKSNINAKPDKVKELLGLLDKDLIRGMALERCSEGPTGMNPITRWLWSSKSLNYIYATNENPIKPEVLDVVMSYAGIEPFRMLDGSGQLPIHICVRNKLETTLKVMLDKFPQLALVENGMGQTAIELAQSFYLADMVANSPDLPNTYQRFGHGIYRPKPSPFPRPNVNFSMLEMLLSARERLPEPKRVLVSVTQASEVAKRLAEAKKREESPDSYARSRRPWRYNRNEQHQDEVDKWMIN